MMIKPLLHSATARKRFEAPGYLAVLLGEIRHFGMTRYAHLFLVYEEKSLYEPVLIVSAEVLVAGEATLLGLFTNHGHRLLGEERDGWTGEARSAARARVIANQTLQIKLKEKEPGAKLWAHDLGALDVANHRRDMQEKLAEPDPAPVNQDLGVLLKGNTHNYNVMRIIAAGIAYRQIDLRVHIRNRDKYQIVLIKCANIMEGGAPMQIYEEHPKLNQEALQWVPGSDWSRKIDPPVKFSLLTLDQSYVIAEKFELCVETDDIFRLNKPGAPPGPQTQPPEGSNPKKTRKFIVDEHGGVQGDQP